MFEFEKPNIEISEISEDNRFGRLLWNRWREDMVQLWVTP